MIINIKQGTKDSKEEYLHMIDKLETQGYIIFDIGSYDTSKKLSEVTLIK